MKILLIIPVILLSLFAHSYAQDSVSVLETPPKSVPYRKHNFSLGCGMPISFGFMSDGSNGYYLLGGEARLSYFFADFTSVNCTYYQTKTQTFGLDTAEVVGRLTGSLFVRRYMGEKRIFFADLAFTAGQLYSHTDYEEPIETTAYKLGYGIGASWVFRKHLGPLNNRLAFEIYYRKLISLKRKDYKGGAMLTDDANLLALHYYFGFSADTRSTE